MSATKFCTCHDSIAVVPCAKFYCGILVGKSIEVAFHFYIMDGNWLVQWVASLTFIRCNRTYNMKVNKDANQSYNFRSDVNMDVGPIYNSTEMFSWKILLKDFRLIFFLEPNKNRLPYRQITARCWFWFDYVSAYYRHRYDLFYFGSILTHYVMFTWPESKLHVLFLFITCTNVVQNIHNANNNIWLVGINFWNQMEMGKHMVK